MIAKADTERFASTVIEEAAWNEDEDNLGYRPVGDVSMQRDCMTCGRAFISEGWHNRMCPRCRKRGNAVG